MTPAALLRELALIAGVTTVWTGLVLLMLERDRKRFERRARIDGCMTTADSSGAEILPPPQTKEPPCQAAQEE